MPIRFRRTFTIFPGVKVNVSKGGISFSVGKPGATLNFSKRGVRQTVGIPGSGVSHSSYIVKNKADEDDKEKETEKDDRRSKETASDSDSDGRNDAPERETRPRGASPWMLLLGIIVIYLGAVVLNLIPINFLSQVLDWLTDLVRQVGL
ncbi:MAG TPA: DUF4236 domain-containing protein [Anaerolineales bacterium]|nr:DUF4236 domain-containing protein [Anaerolineales bacterium]